eukprot:5391655-Prymnesium_polylepis.1
MRSHDPDDRLCGSGGLHLSPSPWSGAASGQCLRLSEISQAVATPHMPRARNPGLLGAAASVVL